MITTCPKCGKAYEESSMEEADSPARLCLECFTMQAMRNALYTAINTVECASIDPISKEELPWYKQAKSALRLYEQRQRPSWIKPYASDTLSPHEHDPAV